MIREADTDGQGFVDFDRAHLPFSTVPFPNHFLP
jgi:hypothetical protein